VAETSFFRVLVLVFGGSLAVQFLAFLRQLVIASAFGIDRAMDLYVMVFAVASMVAFALSAVIENAAVPALVARKEAGDRAGFHAIASRMVVLGAAMGAACGAVLLAAVPLFTAVIARGLSDTDRAEMMALTPWFIPWVVLAIPFYAVASVLKSERRFKRFFAAEIIVALVSMGILLVWRPHPGAIALAYGAGYGVGMLSMLPGSGVHLADGTWRRGGSWGLRRQMWRLFASNQAGNVNVAVDRFLQSYLQPGAIAASSYASLISGQAATLLGFRDAFMVPLSQPDGRVARLERILIGLVMLACPAAAFLFSQAQDIVSILLERGRFDRAAVELSGQILQLQALGLVPAALVLPMLRLLQILDRMRLTAYVLLAWSALTLLSGVTLMFWAKLGLAGYVLAGVVAAYGTLAVLALFLAVAGIRPDWLRIAGYGAYGGLASALAAYGAAFAPDAGYGLATLVLRGLLFGVVIAALYGVIYRQLREIAQPR
jgi:putative peptidoglycan lipid II flippase